MPMQTSGTVVNPGSTNLPDGNAPFVGQGRQGEQLIAPLHGRYYTQAYRGNMYYVSTALAGLANSIFSNTTYIGLMIANPAGSGKNLSIGRVSVGQSVAAGTAASAWGYCWLNNIGSGLINTQYTALTALTATRGSCLLGAGTQGSSVAITYAGATIAAASVFTWGRSAAFSSGTGAITVQVANVLTEDLDGTMIVPPGTMWTVTTAILTGATANTSVIWEETPI